MTRDGGAKGSLAPRLTGWKVVWLVVAVLILVEVPLAPAAITHGSPAPLIGLPVESIIVLALLVLLPWRVARVVVAVGFGVLVVVALVLAAIDSGYRTVLDIHFDPLDWQQLGDAYGVVRGSIGGPAASALLALLVLVAVGLIVALSWAALRAAGALRPRVRGTAVLSAVAAAWITAALVGAHIVAGQPTAAAASFGSISASTREAAEGIAAVAELSQQITTDPYRDVPGSELLTALRGKDVVFAFVESYGRVAVEDPEISAGVRRVLRDGEEQLRADGYASRSAFLTSPTFGGLSWLAHSTLQTGLWIDRQPLYSKLIRSDRFTLSDAFGAAGWRTVSIIPSNTDPWPFGTSFYHWDTQLNAHNMGYRGPSFGYARIPDQYTWKHFADTELARDDQPVMAEIDLVSSHTPWAPLPKLVPWSEIGDGSVFDPQPEQGASATEVWRDSDRVRQAYGQSVEYSLGATFDFLHRADDPNLVIVVLGDHQPATIVSGQGAGHDVPISIIAKDPAVLAAIDGWRWQDGMLPSPDAPVWPMNDFRDRFLAAFSDR